MSVLTLGEGESICLKHTYYCRFLLVQMVQLNLEGNPVAGSLYSDVSVDLLELLCEHFSSWSNYISIFLLLPLSISSSHIAGYPTHLSVSSSHTYCGLGGGER